MKKNCTSIIVNFYKFYIKHLKITIINYIRFQNNNTVITITEYFL